MSKRLGSLSLRALREDGIEALALDCYLAKTGTSDPIELRPSLDALAAEFSFEKIGRAPAHFDPAELAALNAKLAPHASLRSGRAATGAMGIGGGARVLGCGEAQSARAFRRRRSCGRWSPGRSPRSSKTPDFAAKAAELLPPEPWDETTWTAWTAAVGAATGAKGRALFHPLRLALTAREHGPELKKLLPLIGRAKALARLKGETA